MADKAALVTGASRGIGRSIALALAASGWSVGVNYRGDETAAVETLKAITDAGGKGVAVQADISQSKDRIRLLERVLEAFGQINLLVNNAGMAPRQRVDLLDLAEPSYDEVMAVNLKGPFFLTQAVARVMITQRTRGLVERPKIINVGSISAYASSIRRGEYCLSKAGVAMMTSLFADRLAEYGICVFEIRPGIINTDMTAKIKDHYDDLIADGLLPLKRWGQPDDVARAVLAIAENYLPYSTGEVINIDGGFHTFAGYNRFLREPSIMPYRKVAALRKSADFQAYLAGLGISLPFDETLQAGDASPLSAPAVVDGLTIGNRFCILPMEGWDGTPDGKPTGYTLRRWQRFGQSGAKLIWGGEAAAVRHDGRANPNQLLISDQNLPGLVELRQGLAAAHAAAFGSADGLVIGLQLTHSGRYSRPNEKKRPEPRVAYDHPFLNARVGLPAKSQAVFTDGELDDLVLDYIKAARLAQAAGFDFVDVKHCHGYLLHELLSAVERPGRYGGSFENRTRFVLSVAAGIRENAPGLKIGVRLSAFDFVPFHPGADGVGEPDWGGMTPGHYPYAFGGDGTGLGIDLAEPTAFLDMLASLDIHLVCITGGSPYANPHIQRPAIFPPSDGYQPPEDPLIGVHRQITTAGQLKARGPGSFLVGTGYTYLQEWLPYVAHAAVRQGLIDSVGLGRMVLAYPTLPADILAGRGLQRKLFCRSFSDCTTAPRNGMVSGCYPLDELYKQLPKAKQLEAVKAAVGL